MEGDPLLHIRLCAAYPGHPSALSEVEFAVGRGEIFGLVGQSGSGKSTLALSLLGLLESKRGTVRGSIRFGGRELVGLRDAEMRRLRGREMALVPQSAVAAMNPALRLRTQFREIWRAHRAGPLDERAVLGLFEQVSLPAEAKFLERFPGELSVGQGQRVLIAMALLHNPSLLIADEPTSALDVITQAEILALFRQLNRERGIGMIFISHDLPAVASLCHRIGILKDGKLVECGETRQVLRDPRNEYARRLVNASPATLLYERARAGSLI